MHNKQPVNYSHQQKLWKFILLNLTTMNLYTFYWYYRNSKQLYPRNGRKINPLLRTLGMSVPVLGIYLVWVQIRDIKIWADAVQVKSYRSPDLITLIYAIALLLPYLAPTYFAVLLLAFVPLIFVQQTLNNYWQHEQPGLPEKAFSWQEIIFCLLGVGVWIMAIYVMYFLPSLINQSDYSELLRFIL